MSARRTDASVRELGSRPRAGGDRAAAAVGAISSPSVDDLVAALDTDVLRKVRGPEGIGVPARDVVIFDASDPHCLHAGSIVLAVGVWAEGDALALIDAAGRCAAAAVVFRGERVEERVAEAACAAGVAVLLVPPEMRWGQLYSLMRTAISTVNAPVKEDAAGVPLGDLFALADAIAASVGGPVTIEDPHWRVLAYSNLDHQVDEVRRQTILGRTPTGAWQRRLDEAGIARQLRTCQGVVHFEGFAQDGLMPRLVAPVRAGTELLGSIWLAQSDATFEPATEEALVTAAEVAAIHLICHRASEDVKRRTRGAFVREVLEGRAPAVLGEAAIPLRARGPFTVLAFELADGEDPLLAGNSDRVLGIISLYCEDAHREAMCALVDERFWALLPTPSADARARTRELALRIVDRVERAVKVRLLGAVGVPVRGVEEVPRSRRAAEYALRVLARGPGPRVVHIDDVRAHAVLLELLDLASRHPSLRDGPLTVLLDHDRERGTEYASTLRAYLDFQRDAGKAAEHLGVHPNTVRYRLRRAVELSGLKLDDPDERLVSELQLRLAEHGRATAVADSANR